MQKTMRGVELVGHGNFDKLQYRENIATPTAYEGEVLIKVSAAGVNNTDINTRVGWYSKNADPNDSTWSGKPLEFPRIQGADVCGHIVAVGDGVSKNRIGERVIIEPCLTEARGKKLEGAWYFGSECNGGFAEYTTVAAKHAYKIECDLTDIQLASFPCSYSTAENMLTRTQVTDKDVVLITGATGGVGSAAVQLAKARGARVIGVTSPSKADLLKSINTDEIIFREDNFVNKLGANSIDVVIDLVGGDTWPQLLEVLKPGGRYAVSGAIGGEYVKLDLRSLYLKDLTFYGCTVLREDVFTNLVKRIEQKQIQPLVAETFALKDVVDAQKSFMQKKYLGKIVLTI